VARIDELSQKVEQIGPKKRPGWKALVETRQEAERQAPTLRRKTYLLTNELIDRINALAEDKRVGINELVRFLLANAVAQVESGDLEIPTEAVPEYRIKR
jgi:hypothetical protein